MIDCTKARELSNSYIDGILDEAECSAYEEHISCCESCHEEYDMLKKVSVDLSSTAAPLPEGFARRVHTALVNEQFAMQDNKEKKRFVFPYYRAASVMAAALVIAVVGKYGIYDTYKNVTDDTARMAMELTEGNASEVVAPPSVQDDTNDIKSTNDEPVYQTKMIVSDEEKVDDTSVNTPVDNTAILADTSEYTLAPAAVHDAAPVAEAAPAEEEPAVLSLEKGDTDDAPAAENGVVSRMIQPEEITDISENTPEPADDATPSSGGSVTSVAELVPAAVIIHNSGDGSMIMFKKFLLTFLDGSRIADNGDEITVTITADEYESVMQRLRANEYVKSVTEGTPADGKAIINIK